MMYKRSPLVNEGFPHPLQRLVVSRAVCSIKAQNRGSKKRGALTEVDLAGDADMCIDTEAGLVGGG
jgi:hypothetical protein